MATDELWHLVEARRDDGAPAMFRIRDLAPRLDQPRIFATKPAAKKPATKPAKKQTTVAANKQPSSKQRR